jgi:hypothetical protein
MNAEKKDDYEQLKREAEELLSESDGDDIETCKVRIRPTRATRIVSEDDERESPEERRPKRKPTVLEVLDANVENVEKYRPESYFGCLGCAKEILERRAFKEVQYCIPCRLALGLGGELPGRTLKVVSKEDMR